LGVVCGLTVRNEHLAQLAFTTDEVAAGGVLEAHRDHGRRIQSGIVIEDATFEIAQLGAGFETELLAEHASSSTERSKRLGLTPGAVEGEGEASVQPFTQRVFGNKRLQLADDMAMASEGEVGVDARLDSGKPLFFDPCRLGSRCALVNEVDQRRPAPQRKCVSERTSCCERSSRGQLDMPDRSQLLETVQVDRVSGHDQAIAGVVEQELRTIESFEHAAQSGDVAL
jgi:hypothetical protein